jgi:hypothetical protein
MLRNTPSQFDVLSSLLHEFSAEELCQAGLARRYDNKVVVTPHLQYGSGGIMALYREGDSHPFELISERGCVGRSTDPACAVMADHYMRTAMMASGNLLCLAFSMLDVAALLIAGIPATIGTGMAHPNKSATQHLKKIPRRRLGFLDIPLSFAFVKALSSSFVLAL